MRNKGDANDKINKGRLLIAIDTTKKPTVPFLQSKGTKAKDGVLYIYHSEEIQDGLAGMIDFWSGEHKIFSYHLNDDFDCKASAKSSTGVNLLLSKISRDLEKCWLEQPVDSMNDAVQTIAALVTIILGCLGLL